MDNSTGYQDAVQLLTAVWGGTVGNFRVFHDQIRDKRLSAKFYGDFSTHAPALANYNMMGHGVYFVVNIGGNTDEEITETRAIMIDIDKGALPPAWHIEPHLILQRGNNPNYHVYWLIEPTADIESWVRTCRQLIAYYGSDPRIDNPSRVMRLPGFAHCKKDSDMSHYQVTHDVSTVMPRYLLSQIAAGLPDAQVRVKADRSDAEDVELQDPGTVARMIAYLEKADPAVEGDGGDHQTFVVAAHLKGAGLSKEKTLELMLEHYNPRCEPPWDEIELSDKIDNARLYSQNAQGAENPIAAFLKAKGATPPSPPGLAPAPPSPPTPNIAGTDPRDITPSIGYDGSHAENACRFIQDFYPAGTLVNYQDDFLWYDGKAWNPVEDRSIRAGLFRAALNNNPSRSDTDGALAQLRSAVDSPDWNTYNGQKKDDLVLLNNGILDINTGELLPHTRNYLSTNIVPFDYDPTAKAPEWDAFLNSTLEGDRERIQFIEEWLGYNLTRAYQHQKIAMLIGKKRSGKSTIMSVLSALQGEQNFGVIDIDGFANDSKLHAMSTKLSIVVPDSSNPSFGSAGPVISNLKSISGCDPIPFTRKYKSAVSVRFPGKITVVTNNVLNLGDDSGALTDRFLICPFRLSFLGREDVTLLDRLMGEMPGILNRAIAGLRRLQMRGRFVEPSIAEAYREDIEDRGNPIMAFVRDVCELGPKERVANQTIYQAYRMWCAGQGIKNPLSKIAFKRALLAGVSGVSYHRMITISSDYRGSGFDGISCTDPVVGVVETLKSAND